MKKYVVLCLLLVFIAMPSIILAAENNSTEVKGIISEDTVWDKSGSPYIITGNVLVDEGVKLKITEGVDVKFDGNYYIKVKGNLISKGTEEEKISFGINGESFQWAGIELNSRNNLIDHSVISNAENAIVSNGGNVISNTHLNNILGKSYETYVIYSKGDDKISNTHINAAGSQYRIGGIFMQGQGGVVNNAVVENVDVGVNVNADNDIINSVVNNTEEYGIYARSNSVIKNNKIENAYIGINTEYGGNTITYNTVTDSKIGYSMTSYYNNDDIINEIHYNNFINNETHIKSIPKDYSLDFSNNYFGTTEEEEIAEKIYDFYDDFNYIKIVFKPYLLEPAYLDETAPSAPVINEVTDQSTTVTGTAEAGTTVTVKAGAALLGTAEAGADGKFSIDIPKQETGTTLFVTATDEAGNSSESADLVVVKEMIYKQLEAKTNVDPYYNFTVTFNHELDALTVNADSIYVKHDSTIVKEATVSLHADKKSVVISAPAAGYKAGESYVVYVDSAVKSASGKELKQPVKMQFTVADRNE